VKARPAITASNPAMGNTPQTSPARPNTIIAAEAQRPASQAPPVRWAARSRP